MNKKAKEKFIEDVNKAMKDPEFRKAVNQFIKYTT